MQKSWQNSETKRTIGAVLVALVLCLVLGTNSRVKNESGASTASKTQTVHETQREQTKAEDLAKNKTDEQPKTTYRVVSVVDGDTIKIEYEGKTTSVGLLGVNTPETVDPRKDVECFGQEASRFLKEKLEGKTVTLESDSSQSDRDKYNRLLRYVYLDGQDVSLLLIENGYGYEYTYNKPYTKQTQYKDAQKVAESGKRGLWADGVCAKAETTTNTTANTTASTPKTTKPATSNTNASKPANNTTTTKPATGNTNSSNKNTGSSNSSTNKGAGSTNSGDGYTAPNPNCKIKGNISDKKEKIYHVPGQSNYNRTKIEPEKGERWFCTEQEAVNAGWRKAKR